MRLLSLVAIAAVSFWMTAELNAQRFASGDAAGQQIQGEESNQQGSRRGRRGRRSKGSSDAQQKGPGQRGQRGGAQMLDFIFKRFDTDQNGSLSKQEAPDRLQQRFDMLDANGDSSISRDEMQAAFENMQGKAGGKGMKGRGENRGDGNKGGKGKAGKGGGKKGSGKGKGKEGLGGRNIDSAQLMQRMDKNKDGLLSPEEAPERMKKNFDRIDADSNGTISADELKAMFEKMKDGKKQIGRNKSADQNATQPVKPKRPPMAQDGA
jgi:Ca2+-binding EF-hand superfamily protein